MNIMPEKPARRVLVTGDRRWATDIGPDGRPFQVRNVEHYFLWAILDGLLLAHLDHSNDPFVLIAGKAPGADTVADRWAVSTGGVDYMPFAAKWDSYGKAAGAIRNQQMLDEGSPDFVVAVHRDWEAAKGTTDMVKRCEKAGIEVFRVTSPISSKSSQLTLL